jgi:hypothetical protein
VRGAVVLESRVCGSGTVRAATTRLRRICQRLLRGALAASSVCTTAVLVLCHVKHRSVASRVVLCRATSAHTKRPRYAAAAEGVHVLEEEDVDMVSQVADLGRMEEFDTEAHTDKEYWRFVDDWSHETGSMDRALNITRNKISPESTT